MAHGNATPESVTKAVVADWRTGQYSQRQLAEKYRLSAGMIAKLTKGIPKDHEQTVEHGFQFNQALAGAEPEIVSSVSIALTRRLAIEAHFMEAGNKVASMVMKKLENEQDVAGFGDYHSVAATLQKARDAALGKEKVTITNNNTAAAQVNAQLPAAGEYKEIARSLLDDDI